MLRLWFSLFFCVYLTLIFSQTERAQQLRRNAVAISAQGQEGFGFITGERNGELFVVTAAHVVEEALEEDQQVNIQFFNDYKRYTGTIIRSFSNEDIALLAVDKPNNFTWETNCLGQAKDGDNVAFIGREGDWYIPKGQALGTIYNMSNNQIQVDITSVTLGTSGGPLINSSGVIGMIINTDGITATAVHIDQLRSALSEYDYFFAIKVIMEIKDSDGNIYPTKIMKDGRRWMLKNLTVKVNDSWCYDDKISNCEEYGRLYTFEAAKNGCSSLGEDWRLPTDDEWQVLGMEYGGLRMYEVDNYVDKKNPYSSYQNLLEKGNSGFAGQHGGWRHFDGNFQSMGNYGYYWSGTIYGNAFAWDLGFNGYDRRLYRHYNDLKIAHSVRCIQDK